MKILIIQTAFIGDVVLATSLIENLHRQYPDAAIDFLLRKGNEGLLTGHPFLHQVLIWDKKKNKLNNLLQMAFAIRRNEYDSVINVQRYGATGLLTAFSGAKEKIGFDKNPMSFLFTRKIAHEFGRGEAFLHETERNHQLINHLVTGTAMRPKLYPSESDYLAVRSFAATPFITISPSSVWFTKQYPASKWASFIDKIPGNLNIFLLGAPSDRGLAAGLAGSTKHEGVKNICGDLSFLQSAALMSSARMNYVNDSAPMHFASAMNAAVTAVYCSTIPAFGYGPLSDVRHIVQRPGELYCRPCGLHGHAACPQGHFKCALDIEDEQLLYALRLSEK